MKLLILFLLSWNVFSSNHKGWIQYVNPSKKIINVYSLPIFDYQVSKLDSGDDYYAMISIETTGSLLSQSDLDQLKIKYPGYKVNHLGSYLHDGQAVLNLGGLKKNVDIFEAPGGVKISSIIYLTKSEYRNLGSKIRLEYEIKLKPEILKEVEKFSLPAGTCSELFNNGASMYQVLGQYFKLRKTLDQKKFKFENTRERLVDNIDRKCIGEINERIFSFEELMQVKLNAPSFDGQISGATKKSAVVTKIVKLKLIPSEVR